MLRQIDTYDAKDVAEALSNFVNANSSYLTQLAEEMLRDHPQLIEYKFIAFMRMVEKLAKVNNGDMRLDWVVDCSKKIMDLKLI